MPKIRQQHGYSLIELTLVLIIIGIIASVALKSLSSVNETGRVEETKRGLERLAIATVGDPQLVSGGVRTDYGYVGDVGALPPDLDALVTNPGGYATWRGPYLRDEFSAGGADQYFKRDAWGAQYAYSGGITIASTGGSTTITRELAGSVGDLLRNRVSLTVTDLDNTPPGPIYKDSVQLTLIYPNGLGGMASRTVTPGADGYAQLDSVPVGLHTIRMVYLPDNDTLTRKLNINPGQNFHSQIQYYANIWTGDTLAGGGSGSEVLRPMGSGAYTNLTDIGCGSNWQCVDEVTSDDDGSYVRGSGNQWRTDTYATENHTAGSGTIDSVTIHMVCRQSGSNQRARTVVYTHGNRYYGSTINLSSATYTIFSTVYPTNPNTSAAWTWTEIDAMQIGVNLYRNAYCTQVWAEVYYTE